MLSQDAKFRDCADFRNLRKLPPVRVISFRKLREFYEEHPAAKSSLRHWYTAAASAAWKSLADVRKSFASADVYGKLTIFNIGGNKYRLIASIHYNTARVYVRHVLTHAEYDAGKWKR
jgi:mRNA interferase HigB